MKLPLYFPKWLEEAARGVFVAVVAYVSASVVSSGVPDDRQTFVALFAGAVPIAWAALRAALNKTPITPDEG